MAIFSAGMLGELLEEGTQLGGLWEGEVLAEVLAQRAVQE